MDRRRRRTRDGRARACARSRSSPAWRSHPSRACSRSTRTSARGCASACMEAVDELGYEPDCSRQSLRRRATHTVGFVVGDISNPLLAEIALGAERDAARQPATRCC